MPSTNAVKITAGKETTVGTPATRTAVLPISEPGSLDRKIESAADPIIIGRNMLAGEYAVRGNVGGGVPITPRACAGMGLILKSALGGELASPPQAIGAIRIKYTGAAASCKLELNGTADTITSKIGALGAETVDSAFGTAGVISLAATANDTIAELVALIDSYADYSCELVFGTGTETIDSVITTASMQAKGKDAFIVLTGTSGVYAHRFQPDETYTGGEPTPRPTLTVQLDGYGDNYVQAGHVVDQLSLSGALKDFLKGDVTFMGMTETGGASASALTMEDAAPLNFADALTVIDGADYAYVRDVSLKIANGHRDDGYAQGSIDRAYHQRGTFSCDGELTIRLDATALAIRAKVLSGTRGSLLLVFKGKALGSAGAYECMVIEVPYARFSSADRSANSGQFDMKVAWKALSPLGTQYDAPLTVWLFTDDSAVY
ncbi:MAG TPA: phage tail tube protein [Spirochaetales bacterium]|nr:phage tail tube protein [Spirochaetales bacterium]